VVLEQESKPVVSSATASGPWLLLWEMGVWLLALVLGQRHVSGQLSYSPIRERAASRPPDQQCPLQNCHWEIAHGSARLQVRLGDTVTFLPTPLRNWWGRPRLQYTWLGLSIYVIIVMVRIA
jgi:hypothetical protein